MQADSPLPSLTLTNWRKPFFTIWIGQAFSLLGSSLVQFALIWYLTEQTGSGTVLATATLVGMLPQVLFGPIAGTLVDRWNRRVTMMVADGLVALATLILAVLFASGSIQFWQIYALMFVRSLAGGFHYPAMQAATSLMVPKEQLTRVQGFNQMLGGLMSIAAPALGALLLSILPMQGILFIDVSTALLAITPLLFIPVPEPVRQTQTDTQSTPRSTFWADFKAGFTYTWNWKGLRAMVLMAALINLMLTPTFSLLSLLVVGHFKGGPEVLAALEGALGVGVILGGLILGAWGGFKKRIYTTILGIAGIGIGVTVVGLTPATWLWLAIAAMFLLGVMNPITNGPLMAVVQAAVEPHMQGRVFNLIGSLATAMTPLGLLIAGPLSDWLDIRIWFWVAGVITLGMAVSGLFNRDLLSLEQEKPAQESSLSAAVVETTGD
ncbi:MAG: MFS transporter [Anaerolineales bacterium]